jgi:hypothetical protein
MVPSQFGTNLDFSGGNLQQVNLQFSLSQDWIPENCELVVFVQDNSTKEILQGVNMALLDFPPEYSNDAALLNVANIGEENCTGELDPVITIRNHGAVPLTSLDVNYSVNNGDVMTYQWTGNLDYLNIEEISLPTISFAVEDENDLVVETLNPNGNPDEYSDNDMLSNTVVRATYTPQLVNLILRTDANPEETTWEVVDYEGTVLYSGGPYTNSGEMINEEFELTDAGCYIFNIYDTGGDGFMSPGFFMLYYGTNNSIAQGTNFGFAKMVQFNADDAVGIDEQINVEGLVIYPNPVSGNANVSFHLASAQDVSVMVYNTIGERVFDQGARMMNAGSHTIQINGSNWSPGVYFVRILAGTTVTTEKITVR